MIIDARIISKKDRSSNWQNVFKVSLGMQILLKRYRSDGRLNPTHGGGQSARHQPRNRTYSTTPWWEDNDAILGCVSHWAAASACISQSALRSMREAIGTASSKANSARKKPLHVQLDETHRRVQYLQSAVAAGSGEVKLGEFGVCG